MKQIPHRSVYKCLVLLGLIANLAVGYRSAAQTTGYGVAQEVWLGLSTNEFGFELGADFLSKVPNTNRIQLNFSVGSTVNGYAQRLRGFVLPPITGPYTFAVAADDWAELYLSSDETPGNRQRIAFTPSPSGLKNFEAFPSQRSAPITLLSGRRYYIEAIHREGTGADYIDVQWLIPDDTLESPIPGRATGKPGRLIPFRTNAVAVPGFFVQPPPTLSVLEGRPASISLLSSNQSPLVYQWLEDGVEIAGANQPVLELSAATQAANGGKKYRCRVTSEAGSTLSGETLLTITPDTIRPAVISVASIGTDGLLVSFSETVRPPAATQFSIDGVQILGAEVTLDPSQVRLRTTAMTLGASYSLRINGVQDLAGLETEPGAAFAFQVRNSYTTSVGATNSLGTVTTVGSNGYDVTATGRDIAGRTDQFLFEWMLVRGNFDYQVRVESFSLVELLSKGGLMARDDLSSTGRYAAVFATPSINGTIFQSRNAAGKDATVAGLTPVNYPHTWLRLQRQGNVFTGHASTDGRNWSPVSSANILMPEFVYLGLSASSRTTNGQPTSVKFRDFADATGQSLGQVKPSDREPPGPSSRRSGLTISEIMYRPAERPDRRSLEFVEIFNSQPYFEDLSGHRLSGDIDYTFPTNTILPGGGYLVIAKSPADMEFAYGLRGVLGPYSNNIPNDLGTLRLRNELGAILLEVEYESQDPWPIAADGTGHSIVLARPSYGELRHHGWDASDVKGGSPGTMDGVGYEPARGVKINEIMANPGIGQTDFVELFNTTAAEIDLSGAFLSDSPSTNKFQIPPGTRIPARGRVSFTEAELGFGLSSGGETLFLVNASNTRVIDAVRFFGSSRGVSQGRSPDGEGPLHELTTSTPGTANSGRLRRDIVINEIMYAPVSGDNDDEFIELYNRGNQDVSLAGWRIANGVSFNFPSNAMISARGYAVVAKNLARVLGNYPNLTTANAYGNFSGTLANSSDRIQLFMPEPVIGTNSTGSATTNTVRILVDEVAYADGGRWAEWADGGGSSLELIDPESDNALAPNWAASDETKKSEWTNVEFTGRVDLGGMESPGQLHVFLQDAGEALLDDVEVFILGSTNLVRNNGFESGLTGWTVQGTHEESILETREGYNNSRQSLRIRASARGDVGGNRVRTGLAQTLPNNAIATIRAKVRWLAGTPHILIRLRGNYLECPGVMTLPRRLGTPGAMNSRSVPNSAPAIHEVAHFPVLPAPSQDVTVTARISDPQGIARFVLSYRVDATGGTTGTLDMKDDGTGGDATAGDGLYSATIPGQGSGVMVAFHLQATDSATPSASVLFPNDAPTRECLVRFGEPQIAATAFGSYRYWMTAAGVNRWRVRGKQSNHPLDCTFVYGNYRVLYNAQTLYSGSPWHTPGFNGPTGSDAVCDYILRAPADDLLLGAEDFVVGSIGNTDNDASKLAEQSSYWIARKMGIPYNHRRYVFVYFNGVRRASSLYEDTQQPSSDVIAQYWPDDTDGPLHKIEDWFEFDDSGDNKSGNVDATLDQFLTLEGKKVARYRVCWRPRAVGAGEDPNDFTQLFKVVDALSSAGPEPYNTLLPEIVDIQNWLSVFAMQHIVGNWDAYGYNRGKNMYTYKPTRGKFHLLLWDIDFDLGSGSDGPTTDLFITNEPMISRLYSNPYFRRMYLRICMEAADGPLRAEVFAPTLDAKLKGLIDNGGAPTSPSFIKDYVRDRRNYLLGLLPRTNFTVFGSAFIATNAPMITLTGAAPVSAESIYVNGQTYPTAWSVISSRPFFWSMRVPIDAGTNDLVIEARDRFGSVISNGVQRVTVVSSNTPEPAEGNVVISEIAYLPEQPDAGYVEIHNRSATTAFTLTGWRLSGVDFNFPQGAVLPPRSYLVIAKDHFTFGARFAFRVPVIGEFDGNLDPEGEVISLLRPGSAADEMLVVDRVRYEANPPWPLSPAVDGVSLELVDGAQDNSRSSNWGQGGTEWRFVSVTGRPGNTNFFLYLTSTGDAYVDDIKLVTGTQAEVGENLIPNGGFEESLSSAWRIGATHRESAISSSIKQSGGASLQIRANAAGSASTNGALYQTGLPVQTNETYTLSFWVRYGERPSGANLVARFNPGGTLGITQSVNRVFGSPGAPNVSAGTIAAYHPLWLNEISPFNSSGGTDPQGERDPWVELYNAGTAPVDLADYRLSDSYGNLATWSFPAGSVIQGGERRLIWIDGDADVSNAQDWHTPFRAQPTEGSIILSQIVGGQPRVVDYLNYSDLRSDESYGSFPDGQPFYRLAMSFPTPGAANNGASKPLAVRINEWMASNTGFILDLSDVPPAADDWFELFNPGRTDADLGGYYLTDSSQNRTQFRIPAGTIIPAGGYLLVWADNSPGQNSTNSADLHVNFQLARGGEELGLYGADGEVIDLVRFGTQTNNISEGRIPDGGATRVFFAQPTPRSANQLGGNNTPPTLARVGNKIMNERTRLTLDLSATDAEEETSQLVFSLAPGAPVGASITPQGRFVWRPSEAQGPGVFPVTFRVRDNGTPSLIAEESINITVREVNLPPVFADQRGRYVTVGDTLSFSTGVDLDQPAQAVLFRLESEAHAGLSVNPVTGVLTWKPTADQAGRSYTVVVSATDNGVPVLSSSASYIIFVSSADQSSIVVQASSEAGGIVLTWPSAPGDRFQVETKSDLAGQWVPLGNVITATGASSQARDTFGGLMKFYRITKL